MAKRRNAKKEKAARNKINARKFRKTTSRYGNRSKSYNNNNNNNNNTEKQETKEDNQSSQSGTSTVASNK